MNEMILEGLEEEMSEWAEAQQEELTVSVAELSSLTDKAWDLKEQIKDLKAQIDLLNAKKGEIEKAILNVMLDSGFERLDGERCSACVENKSSVKIPRTREDKERFFEWLKQRGIFWDKVNVSSQALNSLWKTEKELAEAGGISEFALPGIEKPTEYKELALRKRRK